MPFLNVGAYKNNVTGFKTKKELREMLETSPDEVHFKSTSLFDKFDGGVAELEVGINYQVTGPDPYTDRRWYATVSKDDNGKVTVK